MNFPAYNERGVSVGMTGSGKTFFARYALSGFQNVAIFDAKGRIEWDKDLGYFKAETLQEITSSKNPRTIYAPNIHELHSRDYVEAFFQWCYERTNTFVYVDEVYGICEPAYIPFYYKGILTRGRERSIGVLSSTQRPMGVPSFIMSEAEHWYVFRLSMFGDREKVQKCVGIDASYISKLRKQEFYYARPDESTIEGPLKLQVERISNGKQAHD